MLACFVALLLLSSISLLSLDLIELAQFLFLSAFTQAGKVGGFFFSLLSQQEVSNCMMV